MGTGQFRSPPPTSIFFFFNLAGDADEPIKKVVPFPSL